MDLAQIERWLGWTNFFSSLGAWLYADHQLITTGPYAWVRHPIYLGILAAELGGLLLYRTWTFAWVLPTSLFLILRARREEAVLAAAFGDAWQDYCQRTPGWLPRLRGNTPSDPGLSALLEVTLMFLPAIPAYLWLWPNVAGTSAEMANGLANLYAIAGSLVIGLRRWRPGELGINRKGVWVSLACGLVIVAGRSLIILATDWEFPAPQFSPSRLLGEFLFYFLLVGAGQELLFRGLIYRAFETWRGLRWAIWGSSLCFGFWHLGGGPLMIAATSFYGLSFALIRWRAGGILGVILVHGLIDFTALLLLPEIDITSLGRPDISHPIWMLLGLGLICAVPVYLWKLHPKLSHLINN